MAPLFLIFLYLLFFFLLRNLFPNSSVLIDYLSSIYGRFGYEIVILASLFESLILINFFVPGILAVVLGVLFSAGKLDLMMMVVAAIAGSFLGYLIDFALGRFGFAAMIIKLGYKKEVSNIQNKLKTGAIKSAFLGFIHPNIGSITALLAGALRINFTNFFLAAFVATFVWYSIWGILIFLLGDILITVLTKYTFSILLFTLILFSLIILRNRGRNGQFDR